MLHFYVFVANRDKVSDAGRANTCRANSKSHHYEQQYNKRRTSRKHGFLEENSLKISGDKKTETIFSTIQKNPVENKDPERVN